MASKLIKQTTSIKCDLDLIGGDPHGRSEGPQQLMLFTRRSYAQAIGERSRRRDQLWVGRNGDIIKTAGSNVSPLEVEDELQQLEGVHSAYVVGIPDRERGQLVVAAIVPREGANLDSGSIEATLRQKLSSYKVSRVYLTIDRSEMPCFTATKSPARSSRP